MTEPTHRDLATRLVRRAATRLSGRLAPLGVALALAALVAPLVPAIGLAPGAPAHAADPGLTLVTTAAYDVQPGNGLVHVTVTIVAKNTLAETKTQKFYFDNGFLALPPGSSGFAISGAPGATVGVSKQSATSVLVRIGFGSHLYSGTSATFTLVFDLKDPGGSADRPVRVGQSLVSFPVWAFASDGTPGSTVSVTFPAGFVVTVQSGSFDRTGTSPSGGTQLTTGPLAQPLAFFAYVVGESPAAFVDSPLNVTVAGRSVALTVRSWIDDPGWGTRTGALFTAGLPVLATAIGLPWPRSDATVVQESVSRVSGGYAGMFDPTASRIQVAYWADPLVSLHEAAHGWFNGSLLADRWANEGFASLYAEQAARALGVTFSSPLLTEAVSAARIPLNAWSGTAGTADRTTEAYGYAASLALARAIVGRAGDEMLRAVWADAAAQVGAYQPPIAAGGGTNPGAAPEAAAGPPDWRSLLDLLEARTGKDFTDLWRTWVVRDSEAALLDARAAARTSYEQTLAVANGWALPRSIRDALRAWQFDAAMPLLSDARTVLAQRAVVEARAARDGLVLPPVMRRLFESGSIAAASAEGQDELNAMVVLETASAARLPQPDLLQRIGLIGSDPDHALSQARASFSSGDLGASLTSAEAAFETWTGAWQEGRRRTLLAVAAFAAVLVATSAIVGRVRRLRREHAADAPPDQTARA